MKLRINGNSVRFRLESPEIRDLLNRGFVQESLCVSPDSRLIYRLELTPADSTTVFQNNCLLVRLNSTLAKNWANSGEDGMTFSSDNQEGGLNILVERELGCIPKPSSEGESNSHHRQKNC